MCTDALENDFKRQEKKIVYMYLTAHSCCVFLFPTISFTVGFLLLEIKWELRIATHLDIKRVTII